MAPSLLHVFKPSAPEEVINRSMSKLINLETLLHGESASEDAPYVILQDGSQCIPQHYLSYHHTLASVEALVMNMSYSDKYPIFVSQENGDIIIQIGIIGYDNYQSKINQAHEKIVYGRKWRVEPNLPTSEIIQTVFLALKKAREHEIRELMRLTINQVTTTPFNNHQDAPFITRSMKEWQASTGTNTDAEKPAADSEHTLHSIFEKISYDGIGFQLQNLEQRDSQQWLVELTLHNQSKSQLPELNGLNSISYLVNAPTVNQLLYGLTTALIQLSDRHVDEHFLFNGVARFSWELDVLELAKLSCETRRLHLEEEHLAFSQSWKEMNYQTDSTRVPSLTNSPLGERIKNSLNQQGPLAGLLPRFI